MTREIKFRAWDKRNKYMIAWEIVSGFSIGDLLHNIFFIPQQFTGLHDKNGKEIYEGDIVRDAYVANANPFIIEWHIECDDGGEYPSYSTGFYLSRQSNELEVIGNIYENPELLK